MRSVTKGFLVIVGLVLVFPNSQAQEVVSDTELKNAANSVIADSISTTSMFEAKRCKIYSEVMLDEMRKAKSEGAVSASHHLNIWNIKIDQLGLMPDVSPVSDVDAFNHSALGLITNASDETPENVKSATLELFKVEANRCSTMVSESAALWEEKMDKASK